MVVHECHLVAMEVHGQFRLCKAIPYCTLWSAGILLPPTSVVDTKGPCLYACIILFDS